jgi:hypothetical protein
VAGILIPNRLTPMSADEAAKALSAAYRQVTGKVPSAKILGLLVGQWAGETGNGKAIHNYNYGNVKHSSADVYYQEFEGGENDENGNETRSVMQFAAYLTSQDGAVAYIKQLQRRPQWWAGLQTGDPQKFVDGLVAIKGQYYFTANKGQYLKLLVDRMNKYMTEVKRYASSPVKSALEVTLGLAIGLGIVYSSVNRKRLTSQFRKVVP